jgi:hypothetical protein
MSSDSTTAPVRNSCHCYHCGKDGFKRKDLTGIEHPYGAFLCPECAAMPGVTGQRLAKYAGLRSPGNKEYWARTPLNIVTDTDQTPTASIGPEPSPSPSAGEKSSPADYVWDKNAHLLNIVTDEETPEDFIGDTSVPAQESKKKPTAAPPPESAGVGQWRTDVFADEKLSAEVKLYLLALEEYADRKTGANCYPGRDTIATKLGWTDQKVRWQESKARKAGWIATHPLRSGWRRSTMLYQFLNPLRGWAGPIQCSKKGRSVIGVPRGTNTTLDCGEPGPEHQP